MAFSYTSYFFSPLLLAFNSLITLNACGLLAGLHFLHHTDKLGSVMLGILGNSFEHFGNKGQYHIFIDTVLCRAELSNWDFAVLGTGILRNTLAVVGAVDIHLATAIGAIEQAREGSCFAPAVRVASDIPTDFLHKVKGLLSLVP